MTIISEINIVPVKPQAGLVAFASFVLYDAVYCGSVAVFTRPDGTYRLSYPNKRVSGRDLDVFHPINRDVGNVIEQAVIAAYEDVMRRNNDRHGIAEHTF